MNSQYNNQPTANYRAILDREIASEFAFASVFDYLSQRKQIQNTTEKNLSLKPETPQERMLENLLRTTKKLEQIADHLENSDPQK